MITFIFYEMHGGNFNFIIMCKRKSGCQMEKTNENVREEIEGEACDDSA